jgi:hypothetical protein
MSVQHDLLRRQLATQATLNKFRGKVFDFKAERHCSELLKFHLKKMGHRLPPWATVKSVGAALRELKARDCDNMGELCGKWLKLEAIAPAQMLMGDVAYLPGDEDEWRIGSIAVCAGPQKLLGWNGDEPKFSPLDVDFSAIALAYRA